MLLLGFASTYVPMLGLKMNGIMGRVSGQIGQKGVTHYKWVQWAICIWIWYRICWAS